MNKKSAKDLAFERERTKLQRQKREAEEKSREKDRTIKALMDKISELENTIAQREDWIERLLEYTELTPEDLQAVIKKDKAMAEVVEGLKTFKNLFGGFY